MSRTSRLEQLANETRSEVTANGQSMVLYLLAASVALAVLSPLLWIVWRASSVGPGKVVEIVFRAETGQIFLNTVVLVVSVTGCSILLGIPLAMLTAQTDLPFARVWTVLAALPLVIPSYIGAFAFDSAFGRGGELAGILAPIGIAHIPSIRGLSGTILVMTLFTYPYVFLTARASLLSLDGQAIEAARTLNHSRLGAFRRVTLPQLKPGIAAGSLLVALYTLSDFGTPAILHFDVFTRMIYVEYGARRPDFAAVLSLLLVGLTIVILVVESRIERADESDAYVNRGTDRPGTISLGYWKLPALGFCSLVALLALVLPPAILVMWLDRSGSGFGASAFTFQWSYVWHSVTTSGLAAGISVLAALPIAYLSARGDGVLSELPERSSYVGYAVPGIVLGLGLVSFALDVTPVLYGTIAILVFAYVVRFFPQAVGTIRSSVLQTDPQLVEAARTLNHSPLSAFRKVVLPLVMPGIVAGAALVFLTSMKELAATLLLKPFDYETLVTYIWLVQGTGDYGKAAVPALVLIGVSALSMVVILGRERYDV